MLIKVCKDNWSFISKILYFLLGLTIFVSISTIASTLLPLFWLTVSIVLLKAIAILSLIAASIVDEFVMDRDDSEKDDLMSAPVILGIVYACAFGCGVFLYSAIRGCVSVVRCAIGQYSISYSHPFFLAGATVVSLTAVYALFDTAVLLNPGARGGRGTVFFWTLVISVAFFVIVGA
mgnify:CR=1 FL=1